MYMEHPTKDKGNLAELMISAELARQGWKIAFPFGENWDYDLIIEHDGVFSRVQVKHVMSSEDKIEIPCKSVSVTNGKATNIKKYTSSDIDVLAAYDARTGKCYFIPAQELGDGKGSYTLRITPPQKGSAIRWAHNYEELQPRPL